MHQEHTKKIHKCSESQASRSERLKGRRKRQQQRALLESAAKATKLDLDGDTIEHIFFDSSSTKDATESANGKKENEELSVDNGDLMASVIKSQLEELKLNDSFVCTQTNKIQLIDSSIQTEEFEYMFSRSRDASFDREDMVYNDNVRFYTGLPTAKVLAWLIGALPSMKVWHSKEPSCYPSIHKTKLDSIDVGKTRGIAVSAN